MSPEVLRCTQQDYNQILSELQDFWDGRETSAFHHPMFIHEFGNSAFVIRNAGKVVAYLFGFISQVGSVGYVHLIAVRASARRQRLGEKLFNHFIEFARRQGCTQIKAITTPSNTNSIAFHKSLGMQVLGQPNEAGIPIIPDYAGLDQPRVIFWKAI
jgi:ribosomal protein S18 acetylase RimI-like enzyme